MKVPTKKVKEEIVDGVVSLSNAAELHVLANLSEYTNDPKIKITQAGGLGAGAFFNAKSAREAAQFFTNLANVLEGREQE